MLYKSLEFKNVVGQKVKVIEIPVLATNNRYYFLVQSRLQFLINALYNERHVKDCYSFRDYIKRKIKWGDYQDVFYTEEFKNNAEL
ncbi:DUF2535 family protein [Mesobacillus foraminis]|uniref:DUF2535 family protein n=1 Tax=Mesobacillus foraminis TaxID=279826 RepID=UPI000EF45C4A|nr:DUF2535 family protein [Mesobacillus foraminis]